jgi:hypothetical protein
MEHIIELKYENNAITIINDIDDNLWFNMYQVDEIFDFKNYKKIIKELFNIKHIKFFKKIVKDYKLYPKTQQKKHHKVLYIHQKGLCTLIVESKKPHVEKKNFLVWITQAFSPPIDYNKMFTINTNTIEDVMPSIGYKKKIL